ncbi:MAG: hypothetical protein UHS54_06670 [Lachnospiraceae bacterium]|nr:hypothetical protein [Lachnospiraceae bacterium]
MRIFEAMEMPCETVSGPEAVGRISAEFYSVYPPGIPVIVPGEKITEEMVGKLKEKNFLVVKADSVNVPDRGNEQQGL